MHLPIRSIPRGAICAALLLTQVGACMTWHPVPGASEQRAGAEHIPKARLRLRGGTELPLHDVTVRADSVIGYSGDARERRAVPVAVISSIDRRQLSVGRTAALVLGTAATATLVLFAAATASLADNIGAVPAPGVP